MALATAPATATAMALALALALALATALAPATATAPATAPATADQPGTEANKRLRLHGRGLGRFCFGCYNSGERKLVMIEYLILNFGREAAILTVNVALALAGTIAIAFSVMFFTRRQRGTSPRGSQS